MQAARLRAAVRAARRLTGAENFPVIEAVTAELLAVADAGSPAVRKHALEELDDLARTGPGAAVRLKAHLALLRHRHASG